MSVLLNVLRLFFWIVIVIAASMKCADAVNDVRNGLPLSQSREKFSELT